MHYVKIVMIVCLLWPLAGIQPITMADSTTNVAGHQVSLPEPLEVQISQSCFVGVSGELWRIEPSGEWCVAEFVNSQVHHPSRSGQLTAGQVQTLAETLVAQDFTGWPDQFGRDPEINPQTITIRLGELEKSLVLNAGEDLGTVALGLSQSQNLQRFRALYQAVEALLQ